MTEELRLMDGDERKLDQRVAREMAARGEGWAVARFTYWYTSRPPIHEAVLIDQRRPPA